MFPCYFCGIRQSLEKVIGDDLIALISKINKTARISIAELYKCYDLYTFS